MDEKIKLKRKIEGIIWDADDIFAMETFFKWADDYSYLRMYDISEVTDHMNVSVMKDFLKFYSLERTKKDFNV